MDHGVMEFFRKATQISKALAYTNILSPNSIFKIASIFGQREGPLDVECHIYNIYRVSETNRINPCVQVEDVRLRKVLYHFAIFVIVNDRDGETVTTT